MASWAQPLCQFTCRTPNNKLTLFNFNQHSENLPFTFNKIFASIRQWKWNHLTKWIKTDLTFFHLQLLCQYYIKHWKQNPYFQCQLLHGDFMITITITLLKPLFLLTTTRGFVLELVWKVLSKSVPKRIKAAGIVSNLHFYIKCIRRSIAQTSSILSTSTSSIS